MHTSATSDQVLAKELVRIQGEESRQLLIVKSKTLLLTAILAFLSAIQGIFQTIPAILKGEADLGSVLFTAYIVIQLSAAGYFMKAKDPGLATQILKLLLIMNCLFLLLGFIRPDSLPLTLAIVALLIVAYGRMKQLKDSH